MALLLQAAAQAAPESKPILEINPDHALVSKIKEEQDEQRFHLWSSVLLEQALLAEGETLIDPAAFVKAVNQLLVAH